jgi:hypothetical protein
MKHPLTVRDNNDASQAQAALAAAVARFVGYTVTHVRYDFPVADTPWEYKMHDDKGNLLAEGSYLDILSYFHRDSIKALRDECDKYLSAPPKA